MRYQTINFPHPPPPRSPNDSLHWSELSSLADIGEEFIETEEALNSREEHVLNSLTKLSNILITCNDDRT